MQVLPAQPIKQADFVANSLINYRFLREAQPLLHNHKKSPAIAGPWIYYLCFYSPTTTSTGSLPPNSILVGFSHISFTFTRNPTDSRPSMIR